jgi:hypothetical protein
MIRNSVLRFSLATNAERLRGDHARNKKAEDDGDASHRAVARPKTSTILGKIARWRQPAIKRVP